MSFEVGDRRELYHWIDQTLRRQKYGELKRSGKGLVRQYLAKVTGLSRCSREGAKSASLYEVSVHAALHAGRHRTAAETV